jgi:hypothetical protein
MANEHDSALLTGLLSVKLHDAAMARCFGEVAPQLHDDACYWLIVATGWIACGSQRDAEAVWLPLFRSRRASRWKMMKPPDRRRWRALPATVTVHRAVRNGEDVSRALAWSLNKAVCARLWPERRIVTRKVPKERVAAYWTRRGEAEILILPKPEEHPDA